MMPVTVASTLKREGWHEGSGSYGRTPERNLSVDATADSSFLFPPRPCWLGVQKRNDNRLAQPRIKEAETMAYRILRVEDDSDSGTEQVLRNWAGSSADGRTSEACHQVRRSHAHELGSQDPGRRLGWHY